MNTWIFLGRRSRINFAGGLGAGWNRSRREQKGVVLAEMEFRESQQELKDIWEVVWKPSEVKVPEIFESEQKEDS